MNKRVIGVLVGTLLALIAATVWVPTREWQRTDEFRWRVLLQLASEIAHIVYTRRRQSVGLAHATRLTDRMGFIRVPNSCIPPPLPRARGPEDASLQGRFLWGPSRVVA